MSQSNGDKARHHRQRYRKTLQRQRNRELRRSLEAGKAPPQQTKAGK